ETKATAVAKKNEAFCKKLHQKLLVQSLHGQSKADTDKEIRSISIKIFGRLFIKSRRNKSDVSRAKKKNEAFCKKLHQKLLVQTLLGQT
ncbi:MAG: hypothetical protein II323_04740, partial [Tidjanibacter sp.]|nr:hypothetical protein [Tidjanibacter sp.]